MIWMPRSHLIQIKSGLLGVAIRHQYFWKLSKGFQCGAKSETKCLKPRHSCTPIQNPLPSFLPHSGIFSPWKEPTVLGQMGLLPHWVRRWQWVAEKQQPLIPQQTLRHAHSWCRDHGGEQLFPNYLLRASWLHLQCSSCSQALNKAPFIDSEVTFRGGALVQQR